MSKFSDLQSQHEDLIEAQASEEILERVQKYIDEARSSSGQIVATQERGQLRANLRYWASYVYEKTGTYPNIDLLAPSQIQQRSNRAIQLIVVGAITILGIILLFYASLSLLNRFQTIPPAVGTAVAQTQTAAVWTPTISATPEPNKANIITWLNQELSAADPLETTLDARYQVTDVSILPIPNTTSRVFQVHIRCDCGANPQCCLPEQMFVLVMRAMKNHRVEILKEVPNNVSEMRVVCYNHMMQIGVMFAFWPDVRGYLNDQITGVELGSRVYRPALP